MHPYSNAVLREMHLHKEQALRRNEVAQQMEFDRQDASAEASPSSTRIAIAFSLLAGRLHDRKNRSPQPLAPGRS